MPSHYERYERANSHAKDLAGVALRASIFVSGGAAVAVLGFIAKVWLGTPPVGAIACMGPTLANFP